MNSQRFAMILTVLNLMLLLFVLARDRPVAAQATAPLLRGRALEIVDEDGHVRAEIKVFPRNPAVKMPDGTTGYPETVLLRLITSKGRPTVKIAATEDGSAVNFGGESDPTGLQILARGATASLKLSNKDGRQAAIKP
jgi:hypothetical protein